MKELVLVEKTMYNEDMEPLDEIVKERYYFHNWGVRYEIIDIYGQRVGVSYTVAICENMKSGRIELFDPIQIQFIR